MSTKTLPSGTRVMQFERTRRFIHPAGWDFEVDGNADGDSLQWACVWTPEYAATQLASVASLLEGLSYLLSSDITTAAACKKLAAMRRMVREADAEVHNV